MKHKISVLTMDGRLLGKESLSSISKNDVLGIAVQTETIGLILSIEEWNAPWGEYGKLVHEAQGDAKNLMELNGQEMTKRIVEFQKQSGYSERSAAQICAEFKRGGRDFYQPNVYELCTIQAHMEEINEFLRALDLPLLQDDEFYWSSSEYSSFIAVFVYFSSGGINYYNKSGSNYVRAVSAFAKLSDLSTSHCEPSEQCGLCSLTLSDEELVNILRS